MPFWNCPMFSLQNCIFELRAAFRGTLFYKQRFRYCPV